MEKRIVAIVRFEKPLESVRRVVDLSHGLDYLPSKANVFIKPSQTYLKFFKFNPLPLDGGG